MHWSIAGTALRILAQLTLGILLARILGPTPYGLVALVSVTLGFGAVVADCGLGAALIQRSEVTRDDIRAVFTYQLSVGALLWAAYAASANSIAAIYGQSEIAHLLSVAALVFPIAACGQSARSLLRRDLRFKELNIIEAISTVLSVVLGVLIASAGGGAWSLVLAQLAQALVNSAGSFSIARHPLRPLLARPDRLASFGAAVLATNIINWLAGGFDTLIIARLYGVAPVGMYNRAQWIVRTPMSNSVGLLQSVLFPAYSRAADRSASLRSGFSGSTEAVFYLSLPAFTLIAANATLLVEVIYGRPWLSAAPLLIPVALAAPFQALTATAGPLLWGTGKVAVELRIQLLLLAGTAIAVYSTIGLISLQQFAWLVSWLAVMRGTMIFAAASRIADLPIRNILTAVRGPVTLAMLLAAGSLCSQEVSDGGSLIWRSLTLFVFTALAIGVALTGRVVRIESPELRRLAYDAHSHWIAARHRIALKILG